VTDVRELARGVVVTAYTGEPAPFAGIVLFSRDGESVEEARIASDTACAGSALRPVVAIDQEGGRVARLRRGVEALPSMMALGATRDEGLAERAGAATAFDLRRAGCTVDFAPVLDLALQPANTVIGTRSFGVDPDVVARMGSAFARGLRGGGIVPTFKHVPGHGSTEMDSHVSLPVVREREDTLRARDFIPFERCARLDGAMMASHVVFEALDPNRPASLSPAILHDLLRERWGFDGVLFTDCMQMDAVAGGAGTVAGAVEAIAAGADCVLISHDADLARASVEALVEGVDAGALSIDRLCEARERVARLRRLGAPPLPLDAPAPYPGIGREIARRAVTLVRGDARMEARRSLVVTFEGDVFDGAGGSRSAASLSSYAAASREVRVPLAPSDVQREQLASAVRAWDGEIVLLARNAHLQPEQVLAIDAVLELEPDARVVSVREPFDIPCFSRARNVIAAYGDDAASLAGLSDVIFGGARAEGTLPVRLAGMKP
jgi:beta-N-acetylhexosaminidase